MKVKATIDITSREGREIVEYLKQFPDEVTFESDISAVEESVEAYKLVTPSDKSQSVTGEYIEGEVFWKIIEEKRRKFCIDNGIV